MATGPPRSARHCAGRRSLQPLKKPSHKIYESTYAGDAAHCGPVGKHYWRSVRAIPFGQRCYESPFIERLAIGPIQYPHDAKPRNRHFDRHVAMRVRTYEPTGDCYVLAHTVPFESPDIHHRPPLRADQQTIMTGELARLARHAMRRPVRRSGAHVMSRTNKRSMNHVVALRPRKRKEDVDARRVGIAHLCRLAQVNFDVRMARVEARQCGRE